MNKSDWQDQLTLVTQTKRMGYGASQKKTASLDTRIRMRVVWGGFMVVISLVLSKIIYLQLIAGGQHQLTSYNNHIEIKRELASRGIVYDVNGIALVENKVLEDKIVRYYPLMHAIAPVMGYISQVEQDEVGCFEGLCYQGGMYIGRTGIEQTSESDLRGRDGGRVVEVDSAGNTVREIGYNQAEKGNDLQLSIDSRLQEIMYRALGDNKGSAVAIDMQGKVMGIVSAPSYDPNNLEEYLKDTENLYFLNRAIGGTYPPGSVYKLVTALAGLSEGKITGDTEYLDTGEIKVGIYRYGNWYYDQYGRTEGNISLERALARSNDIYFYKVGEEVGVDKLVAWSKKFGLGQKTGIELSGERSGLVPDRLWKERTVGEKWFLGNTYHMSIGQGDLLVTPAQVARMTLASVSGRLCKISIIQGSVVECIDLGLKTKDLETVKAGMQGACATGGTAYPFFDFEPWVACKTGTAQHSGQISDSDKAHAWMTLAYPGENPQMILTVMLEAAGEGSAEAGPVAKQIVEEWRNLGK